MPALRIVALLAATALLFGCAGTAGSKKRAAAPPAAKERMTVRTTAYTHTEPGGSKNAIGTRLRFGGNEQSAASDWSWLPLGTRFRMVSTGKTFVIEDYGSALVGRKTVDLYMPNRRMMNAWGVRHVEIDILSWGSKPMSLKMLTPRSRNRHVARMCAALRRDGVKLPGG